jgi:8-oxo-dGTP diphosphatase
MTQPDAATWTHPSPRVYGVTIVDGAVLLVRARSRRDGQEVWWLPGGGIDFLESPVEALRREYLEETGLELQSATLFDVVSDSWVRRNGETAHAIRIIYLVTVHDGDVAHEGDGSTDQARWIALGKLASIEVAPYAAAAIERAAQTK